MHLAITTIAWLHIFFYFYKGVDYMSKQYEQLDLIEEVTRNDGSKYCASPC